MNQHRKIWTRDEVKSLYHTPILDLVFRAAQVHREHHDSQEIQVCTLQSIKTGDCSENCGYCSQSVHYKTEIEKTKLLDLDSVKAAAQQALESGSTRFCMGASGKQVKNRDEFNRIVEMVKEVSGLGLEVCCTLGSLSEEDAKTLKEAGLYAYNHNLDTGKEFYDQVVTTHTYDERIATIQRVGKAGIALCCGGIMGMGESEDDRVDLLAQLAGFDPQPESVPINALVPIEGTPMQNLEPLSTWELLRMIATTRIVLPGTMVRLAAGRHRLSQIEQAFCFLAGANSIFSGEKLLTTPSVGLGKDAALFQLLQVEAREPYKQEKTAKLLESAV